MSRAHLKDILISACVLATTVSGPNVCAQGSFQNLGFEDPILPLVPDANGFVSASNAMPGWTPSNLVFYNNISLGAPAVDLFGPPAQSVSVIEGSFSVVLQAGFNGTSHIAASIEQTGLVPLSARSIQLKAQPLFASGQPLSPEQLEVGLGGQRISMIPLDTQPGYVLYGGDITQLAGQNADLRIAAVPIPDSLFTNFALDAIQFSASSIPEPGTMTLGLLGTVIIGWRLIFRRSL